MLKWIGMEIYLRIPKGWSKPVPNRSQETCDLCGAKLWIGPGNQIYCDQEHNLDAVASLPNLAENTTTIKF
jgi:hypothetical protein